MPSVKKEKGAPEELQAGLPDRSLHEDYRENPPGSHFQANKGQR